METAVAFVDTPELLERGTLPTESLQSGLTRKHGSHGERVLVTLGGREERQIAVVPDKHRPGAK
jgi:hypothetical protein